MATGQAVAPAVQHAEKAHSPLVRLYPRQPTGVPSSLHGAELHQIQVQHDVASPFPCCGTPEFSKGVTANDTFFDSFIENHEIGIFMEISQICVNLDLPSSLPSLKAPCPDNGSIKLS